MLTRGVGDAARCLLDALWAEIGERGDPLQRVAIAHSLADLQRDPAEQIAWDLRALEAASDLSDVRLAQAGVDSTVAAFLPSLHLNLGDGYCKTRQFELAARHCEAGLASLRVLVLDGYLAQVLDGLTRLSERITVARRAGGFGSSSEGHQ